MAHPHNEHRILILGAGYAGMTAAPNLARRTRRYGGRVTLVNPEARFVERLRMHQMAAGQELARYEIPEIIAGAGIEFTHPDDSPRRWLLTGQAAILYKKAVTASPLTTFRLAKKMAIPSGMLAGRGGRRNRLPA